MLLCDDMFPTIPMICTGYMTVSKSQSPIQNKESVLTSKTFLINMIIIGIVLLIGLVLRLIMDLKYKKINNKYATKIFKISMYKCSLSSVGIGK